MYCFLFKELYYPGYKSEGYHGQVFFTFLFFVNDKTQYIPQACVCLQGNMLIGVKSTSKVSVREDFKDRRHWHVWLFSMSFLVFCPWQKCTTSILHIIDMDVLQRKDRYKTRWTTMLLYKIISKNLCFSNVGSQSKNTCFPTCFHKKQPFTTLLDILKETGWRKWGGVGLENIWSTLNGVYVSGVTRVAPINGRK